MDFRVVRARRIFSDGLHNAFTGIARHGERTYIAFRGGRTHISYDGAVRVIASGNHESWELVHEARLPGFDLRDPKAIAFGGKLLIYTAGRPDGTTEQGPSVRLSMALTSEDGMNFSEPIPLQGVPENHWMWQAAAAPDGQLYGTAYQRTADRMYHAVLLRSGDGLAWEPVMDLPVPAGEVYLDFSSNGFLWALVRCDCPGFGPVLCSAKPPYDSWTSVNRLVTKLNGPMVKRLNGGCLILCRRWDSPGRRNLRTDVLWQADGHDLVEVTRLPSGGDTSYAGWLDQGRGRATISYYSSHEWKMDEPHTEAEAVRRDTAHAEHSTPADIFLADVSYPV